MKAKKRSPAFVLVIAGVVLVMVGAGWFMLIAPQRAKATKLTHEVADARAQLAAAQAAQSPSTKTQPIRVADLFQLSRAMPDQPDVPDLLLQLSEIAGETGITFTSITPHDPVLVSSYEQIPIDLVFQGRFYDLSDFLYRLRNLVGVHQGTLDAVGRLFSVNSISFAEGDTIKFPQVEAKLTVYAFVFGNGTPPPVPTPTQAAPLSTVPSAPVAPSSAPTDKGTTPVPAVPKGQKPLPIPTVTLPSSANALGVVRP
jgi:hypothetical protein